MNAWCKGIGALVRLGLLLAVLGGIWTDRAQAQQALGTTGGAELVPFEVLFLQANLARAKGDVAMADRMFSAASRSRYATPTAFVYWARLHRERGNLKRARDIVVLGTGRFPEDTGLRLEQGWLALTSGDWETLRGILGNLSEEAAGLPFAAHLRGRLAVHDGRREEARAAFGMAAAGAHPLQAESFEALAELQADGGQREDAVGSLRRALELSRSDDQRVRLEVRLADLEQSAGGGWYTLRTMFGVHGDSNVNLAPQLFPESALAGGRLTIGVFQRLSSGTKAADAGIRLTGLQTLHVGDAALADYNSTLLGAEAFGRLDRRSHRLSAQFGYDSVFLFFRPAPDSHFSERVYGGPAWQWIGDDWRSRTALTIERSIYYAGNTSGIDDRRSALVDLRLDLGIERTLGEHRLALDGAALRYDARGDNYDAIAWLAGLRHSWNRGQWGTHVSAGYEDRLYNNHRAGRRDHLLSLDFGAQWRYDKASTFGLVAAIEQNLASGPDLYDYRRIIGGLVWQGRLAPWQPR